MNVSIIVFVFVTTATLADIVLAAKKYNALWLLLDDISTERFPEYGNAALDGLLPGWDEFKADGAVYYPYFYAPSSICAPAQVAVMSGIEPADLGGQYQFTSDIVQGKADYLTVPPPEVKFIPEILREQGYYAAAGGKLDYQVADVIPTFYNEILGGAYSDITSYQNRVWDPAIARGLPFFGILNAMDFHQFQSAMILEDPVDITDPEGNVPPLPFGVNGYATDQSILFDTGMDGSGEFRPVDQTDLLTVDIIGYQGDFNETSISQANRGVPGYLPDEIGIKSILAREYDLVRNVDVRIQLIIAALKERGVYDDTLIVIFGDHGSGTYKAKTLLQEQSVRTPLWIKYPADMEHPPSVKQNRKGHNIDYRLTAMIDLFPTTLSVLGIKPDSWVTGKALAGEFAVRKTRDTLYFVIQRYLGNAAYKTFAAVTKDYFYQRFLFSDEAVNAYVSTLSPEEQVEWLSTFGGSSQLQERFRGIATPLFDRLRRMILINADDEEFLQQYAPLAADFVRPPKEAFFDLKKDRYSVTNLLREYNYQVQIGDEIQPWGNTVTGVTLTYGRDKEEDLTYRERTALNKLRAGLDEWIASQRWVNNITYFDDPFQEENEMAEVFWPGGVQPETAVVEVVSIEAVPGADHQALVKLSGETKGSVYRYTVNTQQQRDECELLGVDIKEATTVMNITNSGLPVLPNFVSIFNPRGAPKAGYLYGGGTPYPIAFDSFTGRDTACYVFISTDATFMEAGCPGGFLYPYDTRDSTWNGRQWVGIDPTTGMWTITPITFWDMETQNWNFQAFTDYVLTPLRFQMYTGRNPDGSVFVPFSPWQQPLSNTIPPAPLYWFNPRFNVSRDDVGLGGWTLDKTRTTFAAVDTSTNTNDKGSFLFAMFARTLIPSQYNPSDFIFESFDYECLFWEVGTEATIDFHDEDEVLLITQGVRKGYSDSDYLEVVITPSDVKPCQSGVDSFVLWDADQDVTIGPLKDKINLCELGYMNLTIEAVAPCGASKVRLFLYDDESGNQVLKNVEKASPYTLGGDYDSDPTVDVNVIPVEALHETGKYRVEAKPTPGSSRSVEFEIVDVCE